MKTGRKINEERKEGRKKGRKEGIYFIVEAKHLPVLGSREVNENRKDG